MADENFPKFSGKRIGIYIITEYIKPVFTTMHSTAYFFFFLWDVAKYPPAYPSVGNVAGEQAMSPHTSSNVVKSKLLTTYRTTIQQL